MLWAAITSLWKCTAQLLQCFTLIPTDSTKAWHLWHFWEVKHLSNATTFIPRDCKRCTANLSNDECVFAPNWNAALPNPKMNWPFDFPVCYFSPEKPTQFHVAFKRLHEDAHLTAVYYSGPCAAFEWAPKGTQPTGFTTLFAATCHVWHLRAHHSTWGKRWKFG